LRLRCLIAEADNRLVLSTQPVSRRAWLPSTARSADHPVGQTGNPRL